MPQIIQVRSLLAVITDAPLYVNARNQTEKLSQEYGIPVADMPLLIKLMADYPEFRKAIRPIFIDTITGEYHGQRDGDRSYEVWHKTGSLATAQGLESAIAMAELMGFAPYCQCRQNRLKILRGHNTKKPRGQKSLNNSQLLACY